MKTIRLVSIFIFNFIYFRKFEESLTGSTVKAGLNASGLFQPEDKFKLCFNVKEPQPIYSCKCYAYMKKSLPLSE